LSSVQDAQERAPFEFWYDSWLHECMLVSFLGASSVSLLLVIWKFPLAVSVFGVGILWNFALVKLHEALCLFDDTLITHADRYNEVN
jgi:hypothetical protein